MFLWGPPSDSVSSELFSSRYMLSSCACEGVVEKGGGLSIVSIKEVGDTSDRGGGLEEWEGGTYAILIVHNRLLSHRHLHHMGQNKVGAPGSFVTNLSQNLSPNLVTNIVNHQIL